MKGGNKGRAKGNQGRRGKVLSCKVRVQINCSRSGKVSSCKVVTDYQNDDTYLFAHSTRRLLFTHL